MINGELNRYCSSWKFSSLSGSSLPLLGISPPSFCQVFSSLWRSRLIAQIFGLDELWWMLWTVQVHGCCGRICWAAFWWHKISRDFTRRHDTVDTSLNLFWGTLTILPPEVTVVDGTNLGIDVVKALKKPLLVLGATWKSGDDLVFKTWLQDWDVKQICSYWQYMAFRMRFGMCVAWFCFGFQENEIRVLNINGPRESSMPGIHDESHLVSPPNGLVLTCNRAGSRSFLTHFSSSTMVCRLKRLDWKPHETVSVRMQAIRMFSSLYECCLLVFWAESKDLLKQTN